MGLYATPSNARHGQGYRHRRQGTPFRAIGLDRLQAVVARPARGCGSHRGYLHVRWYGSSSHGARPLQEQEDEHEPEEGSVPLHVAVSTLLEDGSRYASAQDCAWCGCFRTLHAYEGIPAPYDKVKRAVVPEALKVLRLGEGHRFCVLGDFCEQIGWKHGAIVKELEAKRQTAASEYWAKKKEANSKF